MTLGDRLLVTEILEETLHRGDFRVGVDVPVVMCLEDLLSIREEYLGLGHHLVVVDL